MQQKQISQHLLVSFKQLKEMGIPFSREHLWRLEREKKFPRRIRLSPQKIAWFESEIAEWLKERSEARATQEYAIHD